ncbi:MAG TPA: flagellar motor protein MotB, partial [Planctomycetota bacterium]|nr:flagellar motor protein MotB [Planctomycetota bacterium]
MARKKKAEEHENHERWLVSYADFITLLFAFFVVLWSIGQVDLKKFQRVSQAIGESFGGKDKDRGKGRGPSEDPFEGSMYVPDDATRFAPLVGSLIPERDAEDGATERARLAREALLKVLEAERGGVPIKLTLDERGVAIHLPVADLFAANRGEVEPGARVLLLRVGAILRAVKNPVLI